MTKVLPLCALIYGELCLNQLTYWSIESVTVFYLSCVNRIECKGFWRLQTIMFNKLLDVIHHGLDLVMGEEFIGLVCLVNGACAHDHGIDVGGS